MLRILAVGGASVVSMLLVAGLALHWMILPHIDGWRPQLEARAARALGVPVTLGEIVVQAPGWVPRIELRGVTLRDAQGRAALVLPTVTATLSMRSLLLSIVRFELRLHQLVIDDARLDLRRDAAGRVFVAGIDFGRADSGQGDGSAAADWLLRQREVALRRGTVRWTDELRGTPPLALDAVDVVLVRKRLQRHALRIDATPPADWGDRFTLQADIEQRLLAAPSDWRRWSGTAYALLPRADVRRLGRHVALPFDLTEGNGALRAWIDLRDGRLAGATVDLGLRAVVLRLAANKPALALRELSGRVVAEDHDGRGTLALQGFGFTDGNGVVWPAGDLRLTWMRGHGASSSPDRRSAPAPAPAPAPATTPTAITFSASPATPAASITVTPPAASAGASPWPGLVAAPAAPIVGGTFSASRIDLGLLARMAVRLPLDEAAQAWVAGWGPAGVVTDLRGGWNGPPTAPTHWRVQGNAHGLTLAAQPAEAIDEPGRPGLRNADLAFTATDRGGQARLAMQDGALEFPGVFAESSVPVGQLHAQLRWKIDPAASGTHAPPALDVRIEAASLVNADAQVRFSGTWTRAAGDDGPGRLRLDGTLKDGAATRVARYLPLGIPAGPRGYVEQAVRGGRIRQATFQVDGALADFPRFTGPAGGRFRIAGQVDDVTLAYVPPDPGQPLEWPVATQVTGGLVFDRASMQLNDVRGTIGGIELHRVDGGIRDLAERPVLTIAGSARGPLERMLRYVDATPVAGWIDDALRPTTATGDADLALTLALPLDDLTRSSVKGSVTLAGNDVRLRPDLPTFARARGRVGFTESGVALDGVTVRALGGEARLAGGSQPGGALRFTAEGTASTEALRQGVPSGPLTTLAAHLSGQTDYRLALDIVGGRPQLLLTSSLAGLGIALPAPLAKPAPAVLPLKVQTMLLPPPPAGSAPRDLLKVELGTLVQAQYLREWPLSGNAAPRVLGGGIGIGVPPPSPVPGPVSAQVTLPRIDVDAWRTFAAALGTGTGSAGRSAGPGNAPNGGKGGLDDAVAAGYLPKRIDVQTPQLDAAGQTLTKLNATLTGADGVWRAVVDADQLAGQIDWRPGPGTASGRLTARLRRLHLTAVSDEAAPSAAPGPTDEAAAPPALDVQIDDLTLRSRPLGRVALEADHHATPSGEREWTLKRFSLTLPEAQLVASGSWTAPPARRGAAVPPARRTQIGFTLDLADAGALLTRMGLPGALAGGKGRLQGQVGWPGSPLVPEPRRLDGQFAVEIGAGRFLKADPGAARLLSVLSLQSLPRRLSLDFRDVFEQGFAFDSVTGDVKIAGGVASTNNLRMRGLQAAVLMEGQADLAQETQALRVVVVPEINAGTASLAFAAINPALGLGTFLAQMLLRQPLIAAGTREFRITGRWDDPRVERVERRAGAAAPTVAATGTPAEGATASGGATPTATATAPVPVPVPATPPVVMASSPSAPAATPLGALRRGAAQLRQLFGGAAPAPADGATR